MTRALILSRDAALDLEAARRWLKQPGAGDVIVLRVFGPGQDRSDLLRRG